MNELITFQFETFSVRVVMVGGEPRFVAKDVAEALGYKAPNTAIENYCRGMQELHPIIDILGHAQNIRVIRESDIYRLIANSILPEAARFDKWISEEVLPSIRKTSSYLLENPEDILSNLLANPEVIGRVLIEYAETKKKLAATESALAAAQPAVQFYDKVAFRLDSEWLIRVAAKTLLGRQRGAERRLVEWLLRHKWITKTGSAREASAYAVRADFMRQRIDVVNGYPYQVAVVTGKGMRVLCLALRGGKLFTAGIPSMVLMPSALNQ